MPCKSRSMNEELLRSKREQREFHFRKIEAELKKTDDSDKRIRISDLPFSHLREELQDGNISAAEAVDAFRWKAFQVHQKFNCLVEFVVEATETAQSLDAEFGSGGKTKPPLFGMPFSVKENVYMRGYETTAGLAKWIGQKATEDNTLVAHLRSLGAVPIVRTNVPQTCMSFTCSNPLFGTTCNPFDVSRTPGGSSGGEGCLISAGGCPFGVGSDIGGSLRIPAHFCGIPTLKPTSGRPKITGGFPGIPGVNRLALSYGYFVKDVSSLCYLFELTLVPAYFKRVPTCIPLPLNIEFLAAETAPLRIGIYSEDGWFQSVPACKRAVAEAGDMLQSLGHQVIPIDIPNPEKAAPLIAKCLFMDNGAYFIDLFRDEEVDPNLKQTKTVASVPLWVRWIASKLVSPFDRKAGIALNSYVRDLKDLRSTFEQVDTYTKEFISYWQSLNLDVVIGTVLPFPALPHNGPMKLSHGVFGTMLYNLLDFPAGVVPVTNVTSADEAEMKNYPSPEASSQRFQHPVHKYVREAMQNSKGLPVGVQVIALPNQEELCLKVMRDIEAAVRRKRNQ